MSKLKVLGTARGAATSFARLRLTTSLVALACASSAVNAAEIYKGNGTVINLTTELAIGLYGFSEDYTAANQDHLSWQEGYAKSKLTFEHAFTNHMKLFGGIGGIINGNRGDGDPIGVQVGDESHADLAEAYGGLEWTSGFEGGPSVKLSGGRQVVSIGDSFLIGSDGPTAGRGFGGQYDQGGAYYLHPWKVFAETVLLSVETGSPLRFDAFYLGSEKPWQGKTSVAGFNTEYVDSKWGKLGFMYIRGLDVEMPDSIISPFTASRDGLNVYSISGSSSLGLKDFNFAFNYVNQQNDSPPAGVPGQDSWAWYGSATYTFSQTKWTPSIQYRFASFSGDDPDTAEFEGYDPLFYGFTGYNTWFLGEIAANYTGPFNQNADIHSLTLKSAPNIDVGIGTWTGLGTYVNHYSTREDMLGVPNSSGSFGTELALFSEFMLFDDKVYLSPLYSVMFPDEVYEQTFGKDDTVHNFQLLAIFTY